jgi:hypothetical protein
LARSELLTAVPAIRISVLLIKAEIARGWYGSPDENSRVVEAFSQWLDN